MQTNKTLKTLIIVGLVLLMATPFVVSTQLYFPFITGKAFFFRTLVSIIFVLWVILAVRDKQYRPRKNVLLISFSLFVISILISNTFGANFENSMFSRLERMEGFITLANLYGLFLVASSVMREKKDWNILFHFSVAASVIMAIYGIFQLTGKITINQGGVRLDGTLGNAIYLAVYMLFNIFITLIYLARNFKSPAKVSVYFIALVFQLITLYFTATRGAILGVVGGILITLILSAILNKENKIIKNTSLFIGATIIVGTVMFIMMSQSGLVKGNPVLARFSNLSFSDRTISARLMIWDSAWEGFKDRPILGWGQGNFSYPFATYYKAEQHEQEPWFDRAHNVVFDWLIAGGIIGLILYLSLFGTSLYLLWFKENDFDGTEKAILTGLLSGYGFQNLSVFDNIISYIYFILIMAYISSRTKSKVLFEGMPRQVGYAVVTLSVILIPWQLYAFNVPTFRQAKGIFPASLVLVKNEMNQVVYRLPGGLPQNVEIFRDLLNEDAAGNREVIQSLIKITSPLVQNENISQEHKNQFVLFVSSVFDDVTRDDSQSAFYWSLSARFHGTVGATERALTDIEKAIELSPQKQDFYVVKSQILYATGRVDDALATIKYSYELQKGNDYVWEMYLTLAKAAGREDVFNELIKESVELGEEERLQKLVERNQLQLKEKE